MKNLNDKIFDFIESLEFKDLFFIILLCVVMFTIYVSIRNTFVPYETNITKIKDYEKYKKNSIVEKDHIEYNVSEEEKSYIIILFFE